MFVQQFVAWISLVDPGREENAASFLKYWPILLSVISFLFSVALVFYECIRKFCHVAILISFTDFQWGVLTLYYRALLSNDPMTRLV